MRKRKDMKNTNKRSDFEKEWHDAFEGAEMQPSEDLWTKLDAHLANDKADNYKKRILYYKLIAAASVLLAILVGLSTYIKDDISSNPVISNADKGTTSKTDKETNALADNTDNNSHELLIDDPAEEETMENGIAAAGVFENKNISNDDKPLADKNDIFKQTVASATNEDPDKIDKLGWQDIKVYHHVYTIVNRHEIPAFEIIEEQEESPLWAGVKFSSGVFDPNFTSGSSSLFGIASSDALAPEYLNTVPTRAGFADSRREIEESSDPGLTFSFGFNFGLRLSKRFILQSGFAYTENTSSSNTSAVIDEQSSAKTYPLHVSNYHLQELNLSDVRIVSDKISVNNRFEFVSIPVKAGYILLDKKVSIVLSAGLSTDIFLKNNMSDKGDTFSELTIQPGSASPYKSFSWNGLASTQLLYNFSDSYSLALEPSYMISLTGLTKGDYYYKSRPRAFSVGVGLRYHFK